MKVLLDVNVVLDFLLVRQPWYPEAAQVWEAHRNGHVSANVAAFGLPTIYYIVRRHIDRQRAHDCVQICLTSLEIVSVQRSTLELSLTFAGNDFEDDLQMACATEANLDAIVTRDRSGFSGSSMLVLTPAELLARIVQGTP